MTKEHTVVPVKIDKRGFNPEAAPKAAQELWEVATGRLQIKLAFDLAWGTSHPHVLGIWDDEGPLAEAHFADPAEAKQAYDTMNATFRRLYEKGDMRALRTLHYLDLAFQFFVIASATLAAVALLFSLGG
jgi:hypothetical protein